MTEALWQAQCDAARTIREQFGVWQALSTGRNVNSTGQPVVASKKSVFPDQLVATTGFPVSIASAMVRPNPSARCSDT